MADDKNTSVQTVRSQLKMVFNKMNVNSQTDLVRHVLTSAHMYGDIIV
ncbi:helix-turn-helix transcriptional regulator [Kangiella sp.]